MFRKLFFFYIIIYFLYILLGHRFIRMFIYRKKNNIYSESIGDVIFRGFLFCYFALLYNAYYFYNPTTEKYVNALFINMLAIGTYVYKFGKQKDGILLHVLLALPLLLYRQDISSFSPLYLSLFTVLLLISYQHICKLIAIIFKNNFVSINYQKALKYCKVF